MLVFVKDFNLGVRFVDIKLGIEVFVDCVLCFFEEVVFIFEVYLIGGFNV